MLSNIRTGDVHSTVENSTAPTKVILRNKSLFFSLAPICLGQFSAQPTHLLWW